MNACKPEGIRGKPSGRRSATYHPLITSDRYPFKYIGRARASFPHGNHRSEWSLMFTDHSCVTLQYSYILTDLSSFALSHLPINPFQPISDDSPNLTSTRAHLARTPRSFCIVYRHVYHEWTQYGRRGLPRRSSEILLIAVFRTQG